MNINFYIKNNVCVGYSESDLSKALSHDSVIIVDGHLDLPWGYKDGEPYQLTLEEATKAMQEVTDE